MGNVARKPLQNQIREDITMGLRIQNNVAALNAHRNLSVSDSAMSKSLERLSSGYRINRAADDSAGLAISSQFRADIASYKAASRNASEANSLLQTAEGAMDQISNMLTRLKELATQASSSNSSSNLTKINQEGDALIDEINRISSSTEYAGAKLLDGSFGVAVSGGTLDSAAGFYSATGMKSDTTYTVETAGDSGALQITVSATIGGQQISQTLDNISAPAAGETSNVKFDALGLSLTFNSNLTSATGDGTIISKTAAESSFQVGAKNTSNDRINISLGSVNATTSVLDGGLGLAKGELDSATEAQGFLTKLDTAIGVLSTRRSSVGAAQNQLSYASAILATTIENTTASESVIRDVDMAQEMTNFTKNQILMQAGTSMLAQANMAPQQILSLFG